MARAVKAGCGFELKVSVLKKTRSFRCATWDSEATWVK